MNTITTSSQSKRRFAILTGGALVFMAVLGGYTVGYAYNEFYQPDQLAYLKDNVLSNQGLYRNMLIGIFLILLLDVWVSYTLYKYFEDDNRKISFISSIIRIIYTVIFGVATYFLTENLRTSTLTNEMVISNFHLFQTIWNVGLVIFGLHVFLIGVLMKLHRHIPKILWYITLVAGISYVIIHLLKLATPNSEIVGNIEMILALPMALGELGLAIWLILKGGKVVG